MCVWEIVRERKRACVRKRGREREREGGREGRREGGREESERERDLHHRLAHVRDIIICCSGRRIRTCDMTHLHA